MKKYLILIGLIAVVYTTIYYSTVKEITVIVKDKERITESNGEKVSSKYLVYTENEVFENTDALMFFKFNSSDVQGKLDAGQTYKLKVVGWRVPFLSMYRNIVKIEK